MVILPFLFLTYTKCITDSSKLIIPCNKALVVVITVAHNISFLLLINKDVDTVNASKI